MQISPVSYLFIVIFSVIFYYLGKIGAEKGFDLKMAENDSILYFKNGVWNGTERAIKGFLYAMRYNSKMGLEPPAGMYKHLYTDGRFYVSTFTKKDAIKTMMELCDDTFEEDDIEEISDLDVVTMIPIKGSIVPSGAYFIGLTKSGAWIWQSSAVSWSIANQNYCGDSVVPYFVGRADDEE